MWDAADADESAFTTFQEVPYEASTTWAPGEVWCRWPTCLRRCEPLPAES